MGPYQWCLSCGAKVGDCVESTLLEQTSVAEIEAINPDGVRLTDDGVTLMWDTIVPGAVYRLLSSILRGDVSKEHQCQSL